MEDGAVGNFIQRAIVGSEDECSVIEMGGFDHVSEANPHDRGLDPRLLARLSPADGVLRRWTSAAVARRLELERSTPITPIASTPTRSKTGRISSPRIAVTASPRPKITRPGCRSGIDLRDLAQHADRSGHAPCARPTSTSRSAIATWSSSIKIVGEAAGVLDLVANFLVVRTMQDGGMTLFAAGRYVDRLSARRRQLEIRGQDRRARQPPDRHLAGDPALRFAGGGRQSAFYRHTMRGAAPSFAGPRYILPF